jgi:hypothetical protein
MIDVEVLFPFSNAMSRFVVLEIIPQRVTGAFAHSRSGMGNFSVIA